MSEHWRPNSKKYIGSTYYRNKQKNELKPLRSKLFIQTMTVLIIFFLAWGVFQFNGPIFAGVQETIRCWFTEDTDVTPVFNVIKKIGLYGDSFERAGYEVVSPKLQPQVTEPMTIPVSGTVTKPYGWTIVEGQSSFHNGLVIEAPVGTPIKVAYAGTVLEIKKDDKLGRVVVISHKNGLITTYGYCSEILVKVDQQVKQGQFIAKVGKSESGSQGELYFEANKLGEPVNPMELLGKNKDI